MARREHSIVHAAYFGRHYIVDLRGADGPGAYRTGLYLQADGTWKQTGDSNGTDTDSFLSPEAAVEALVRSRPDETIIAAMSPALRQAFQEACGTATGGACHV